MQSHFVTRLTQITQQKRNPLFYLKLTDTTQALLQQKTINLALSVFLFKPKTPLQPTCLHKSTQEFQIIQLIPHFKNAKKNHPRGWLYLRA